MPIENPTQPIIPLLKALRKRKLRVDLRDDSARVRRDKSDGGGIEVFDLVREYAQGNASASAVADAIHMLLTVGGDDVGEQPRLEDFGGDTTRFNKVNQAYTIQVLLRSPEMRHRLLNGWRVTREEKPNGGVDVVVSHP